MNRFAFINIPSQELERPPAAAAAISACVRHVGWDCKIFDFNLFLHSRVDNDTWSALETYWRCKSLELSTGVEQQLHNVISEFSDALRDYDPNIIGVSVFTRFSVLPAWVLLQRLRKEFINSKLVIGGNGCYAWPGSLPAMGETKLDAATFADYAKQTGLIDHYFQGEAEISVMEYLQGQDNVAGMDGNKTQQILDLESLPHPEYEGIEPENYYYTHQPGIYITATRGCVRKCTFCNIPDLWPRFTSRSADDVVREIITAKKKYNVNLFHFTDSLLNGNMRIWRDINRQLAAAKAKDDSLKDIIYMGQFICRTRMDQTESDWDLMARGGANLLVTGIESYSPHVRKHMGKHYSNADIDFHFAQSAKHGIRTIALMFVGYPVETLEDHEYNLEFLRRYQKYARSGTIHMVRWGYTGMFRDGAKVEKPGEVKLITDPDFAQRLRGLPQGIRDIAMGFGWINELNPTLDLRERIRRRLEVHDLSVKLGWPQTRNREELQILYNILKNLDNNKINGEDFEDLETLLDFH